MPLSGYLAIIEELKAKLAEGKGVHDEHRRRIAEQARQRFVCFLEADQTLPMKEVIHLLERKWRADGLIGNADD